MVFVLREVEGGGAEFHAADFALDLPAEGVSDVEEAGSGYSGEVAFGEFGLDQLEFLA